MQTTLEIATQGRGTYEITPQVTAAVTHSQVTSGLAHLFIQHTSASLLVCENADPAVREDLEAFMSRSVPDGDPLFRHTPEGPDDMPAHVRSVLTDCSLCVPVVSGQLGLGTWQGIYIWEHRRAPHRRRIVITVQEV
ncbi:MAG: secondary thiamine-phosphate synthase enzyme YjbQ [Gammaproteobacteria bacterium]|nr:secondary thiamine-phosphate synthase enzyme YjbQ [Gammaproteobacteria bacterium]